MLTRRTHQCEFCGASFEPRAQVKNPRACKQSDCQRKRQRSNELSWRERHGTASDREYHHLCKEARISRFKAICEVIVCCLRTGAIFLGKAVPLDIFPDFLFQFLLTLGVRKVNKFWPGEFVQA